MALDSCSKATFMVPSSVKLILDFLCGLNRTPGLLGSVSSIIDTKLRGYFPGRSYRLAPHLQVAVNHLVELRRRIVKDADTCTLEHSGHEFESYDPNIFADTLITYLPRLCSALLYLHFQVSEEYNDVPGGLWATESFGRPGSFSGYYLTEWLTDTSSSIGLMPGGFDHSELMPVEASSLSQVLSDLVSRDSAKPLHQCQFGFFLLQSGTEMWHNSGLGPALCFVKSFCDQVRGNKLDEEFWTAYADVDLASLKYLCRAIASYVGGLLTKGSTLYPLHKGGLNVYRRALDPRCLNKYVSWLIENLDAVCESLKRLCAACPRWNVQYNLKTGLAAGPFKYGFVFGDGWIQGGCVHVTDTVSLLIGSNPGYLCQLQRQLKVLEPKRRDITLEQDSSSPENVCRSQDSITDVPNNETCLFGNACFRGLCCQTCPE